MMKEIGTNLPVMMRNRFRSGPATQVRSRNNFWRPSVKAVAKVIAGGLEKAVAKDHLPDESRMLHQRERAEAKERLDNATIVSSTVTLGRIVHCRINGKTRKVANLRNQPAQRSHWASPTPRDLEQRTKDQDPDCALQQHPSVRRISSKL